MIVSSVTGRGGSNVSGHYVAACDERKAHSGKTPAAGRLTLLARVNLARSEKGKTAGRREERWFATQPGLSSLSSLDIPWTAEDESLEDGVDTPADLSSLLSLSSQCSSESQDFSGGGVRGGEKVTNSERRCEESE